MQLMLSVCASEGEGWDILQMVGWFVVALAGVM
jgi:hypothetical protein